MNPSILYVLKQGNTKQYVEYVYHLFNLAALR